VDKSTVIIPPQLNFLHFQAKEKKENQKLFHKMKGKTMNKENFHQLKFQNYQEYVSGSKIRKKFNQIRQWISNGKHLSVHVSLFLSSLFGLV